ncbi:MAG: bifunctional diaminohydroxyphosphoribosylaminopyrimidine deaminase/5-amino-6-(5-phosphoribosylamino)uracil reductase RibD [Hyphomicrobiales bacterium]
MSSGHETFMRLALAEGLKNRGATAENPSVGCVIVKDGKILARAVTAVGGRPHAESQALNAAGAGAEGATAYVTLEPCAHEGNTPSCAKALVHAGISQVVTALEDPDQRTAGKGHEILCTAGVKVISGVLESDARENLAGFLSRHERGRPFVTLKLAVSADGMIAAAPGKQTEITGEAARDFVHHMRAEADAIMIGAETARTDDPSLTCRIAGLEDRSPVRVVVTSEPQELQHLSMLKTAHEVPALLLSSREGANIIACAAREDGKVDLNDGLGVLAGRGISQLMVEGGGELARELLKADLVDEIALIRAPVEFGKGGVAAPLDAIDEKKFALKATESLGADTLTLYVRAA